LKKQIIHPFYVRCKRVERLQSKRDSIHENAYRMQEYVSRFETYLLRCKSKVLNPFTWRIYSGIYLKRSVHVLLEGLAWDRSIFRLPTR